MTMGRERTGANNAGIALSNVEAREIPHRAAHWGQSFARLPHTAEERKSDKE
jgi:hypothetical protein